MFYWLGQSLSTHVPGERKKTPPLDGTGGILEEHMGRDILLWPYLKNAIITELSRERVEETSLKHVQNSNPRDPAQGTLWAPSSPATT